MKIKALKVISATLALTIIAPLSTYASDTYSSAMFGFSEEKLAAQLGKPQALSIDSRGAVLYCQSEINLAGKADRTRCYDKLGNLELASAVEEALASLNFTPAEVAGKAVPVRMSYRIGFSLTGSDLDIALIPNLGSMQERYGRDYIAPQERLDVSDWYDRYNKHSWVHGQVFLGDGALSRVAATVDKNGNTGVVRAIDPERAYKRDANIVKNALKKSRFIPGMVNGKPVPMGYLAVVNYGESGEAVSSR